MNDRALKVLEQYELEILSTRRGRGSYIFETPQGLRILCDYTGSEYKALFQNCVMNQIRAGGYQRVDLILPNKEGRLISRDWEENKYVVKEWYTGRECDTASESEIIAAVSNLARLHRLMYLKQDSLKLDTSWKMTLQGEEELQSGQKQAEAGKERIQTLSDEEQMAPEGAGAAQEACKEPARREQLEKLLYDRFCQNFTAPTPQKEISSHNAELKKIRSFVRGKNQKGDFERLFLERFSQYFEQAQEAEQKLRGQEFPEIGRSGNICHGDYNHHHILMTGYEMATTNFEACRFDFQVNDLYRFMRKILEKHDWNLRLGMRMLENYTLIRPLGGMERRLLYVKMLYPEKFWKLANYYYGSSKAWISGRYLDKLEKLNRQEADKNQFLQQLER